eukprot:2360726-Rhodomonas_salina.3
MSLPRIASNFAKFPSSDGRETVSRAKKTELIGLSDSFEFPTGGGVSEWGEKDDLSSRLWDEEERSQRREANKRSPNGAHRSSKNKKKDGSVLVP